MFFFTQISDKNVGATYMTFLNTVANLSRSFTNTATLYIANFLTFKYCTFENVLTSFDNTSVTSSSNETNFKYNETAIKLLNNTLCSHDSQLKICKDTGGLCSVAFDPYYLITFVFFMFGLVWLTFFRKRLNELELLPKSEWTIYQEKIKLKKVD